MLVGSSVQLRSDNLEFSPRRPLPPSFWNEMKGRVVPLSQIHSLRPSLQPRAFLDIMASAHTTRDDKNEAMQEILILAKDKVGVFLSYVTYLVEYDHITRALFLFYESLQEISRWFLEVSSLLPPASH